MKLKEYISLLAGLYAEHGDLEVATLTWDGYRREAPTPVIDHKAVLSSKERRDKFCGNSVMGAQHFKQTLEQRRGEKVVRV